MTRPWPSLIWPALLLSGVANVVLVYLLAPHHWPTNILGIVGLLGFVFVAGFFPQWQVFGAAVVRGARLDAVALTFDDGPDPTYTPRVLDVLDAAGAKATFFLVGERASRQPEVARDIVERGHQVAFHGHAHRWSLMVSPRRFAADFDAGMAAVRSASGVLPRFFRPPVGLIAPPVFAGLRRWGARMAAWSVRPFDGRGLDAASIVERVLSKVRGGDIVLLHDAPSASSGLQPNAVDALPAILQGLGERGLAAVTLAELVGEPAYLEQSMAPSSSPPRRSFMEWATLLMVVFLAVGAAGSANAGEPPEFPAEFRAACEALASHATVQARFDQRKTSILFSEEVVRTGDLRLRRSDGRLIWGYDDGPQVLMADGRFYPAGKSKEELGAAAGGWALPGAQKSGQIMEALFGLDADVLQSFFDAEAGPDSTWILRPRDPAARGMFSKVSLMIGGTPTALRVITMDEASGDETVVTFSKVVVGEPLADALFQTPAERSAAP